MEKVEKKSNNTVIAVVITILVMLVIGLGGFIGYDKLINKTDTESTTTKNESNESKECDCPEVVEEEKGKCPLTKFDSSYTLTDEDKEEILDAIVSYSSDLKRENINKNMLTHYATSNNTYYTIVSLAIDPDNIAPVTYFVVKVNGKFKIALYGGNGLLQEYVDEMANILEGLCN